MDNLGEYIFNMMLSKDHTDHQFAFGLVKNNIKLLSTEDLLVFYLISLYYHNYLTSEFIDYCELLEEIIPKNIELDKGWESSTGNDVEWSDIPHNYSEAIMFIHEHFQYKLEILKNLVS